MTSHTVENNSFTGNLSKSFWGFYENNKTITISGCVVIGSLLCESGRWLCEKYRRKRMRLPDGPVGVPIFGMAYHRSKSASAIGFCDTFAKYDCPLVSYTIGNHCIHCSKKINQNKLKYQIK